MLKNLIVKFLLKAHHQENIMKRTTLHRSLIHRQQQKQEAPLPRRAQRVRRA